jgi:DNA-binding SARP family transcriptional activator
LDVEFRILGPLEVLRDGTLLELGGPRQRALLALLLTRAGTVVSRDRLVDELWDEPPASVVNVVQTYVSHLRKVLPPERLATRAPGYVLGVEPGELDLHRFELLAEEGRRALAEGDPESASRRLGEALELWRGPALGDVADATFARIEAARLEEVRLGVLEDRFEADLAAGRHGSVLGELEALTAEHPLRERARAQLMLALYRSGRQSEALDVFRDGRSALVELGLEPGPALRELQAALLRQDQSLELEPSTAAAAAAVRPAPRSLLVVGFGTLSEHVLRLAEPLARRPAHELVLLVLVGKRDDLEAAGRAANEHKAALGRDGVTARAAALTSEDAAADLVRLISDMDVALAIVDAADRLVADRPDLGLSALLEEMPCDVVLMAPTDAGETAAATAAVIVPFGGATHEWAAIEVAAWLASAEGRPLRLAGVRADAEGTRRDASRLLARAALLVQQVTSVETETLLIEPGPGDLVAAARDARALVLGLPDEWRSAGLGPTRATLAGEAPCPVLLVRGGPKPGGLAPAGTHTRFTWTIAADP